MENKNAKLRRDILKSLYLAREQNPSFGELTMHELKQAHGTDDAVDFALGVLAEIGYIKYSGFCARITGMGVIAVDKGAV